MIDLAALAALRAVDDHGSVVAAAHALGFTPSAVSQQVKRLERQVGVPLLERAGRGVLLTRHGRHLADEGGRLLADLEQVESGLHRQAGAVAGRLRVAAFTTAISGLIAPAAARLLERHPHLRLAIAEHEPSDGASLVAAGHADIGVVHGWSGLPLAIPGNLTCTPLTTDTADVIMRRGHPLAARPVVTPRDLLDEDWIANPDGSICRQWLTRMYDGTGRLPRIAHVSLVFDSHLALVRAGLGVALIPRMGRAQLGDDLVAVPATDPAPVREIVAVHRATMDDSPAVQAILAALACSSPR
jgi:DNA-binding transcriptional LysR family regulator